jgi:hypothetical protein
MKDSDHGPPVPPEGVTEEQAHENVEGVCKIGLFADHTHEHSGWRRWSQLAWYGLVIVLAVWGFFDLQEQHDQVEELAESNKQILVTMAMSNEANCKTRNEQLKRAAASAAASGKFLEDVGKKLAVDGNPETAKFVEEEIEKRQAATASTQPPAVIDCTQFRRSVNGEIPAPTTTTTR